MAVYCSLPLGPGGAYKNILLMAKAPASVAAQSAPRRRRYFRATGFPRHGFKKLAPFFAPPPLLRSEPNGGGRMNSSTILGMAGADNSANCFDLSVLRETPTRDLPRSCGGAKPDWLFHTQVGELQPDFWGASADEALAVPDSRRRRRIGTRCLAHWCAVSAQSAQEMEEGRNARRCSSCEEWAGMGRGRSG